MLPSKINKILLILLTYKSMLSITLLIVCINSTVQNINAIFKSEITENNSYFQNVLIH